MPRRRLNWRPAGSYLLGLLVFGFCGHICGNKKPWLLLVLAIYFLGSSGGCLTVSAVSRITRPELPETLGSAVALPQ